MNTGFIPSRLDLRQQEKLNNILLRRLARECGHITGMIEAASMPLKKRKEERELKLKQGAA
jgi:hypothetical protein